ncbi:MAG TPA: DUF3576 domain-containing protein [Caulobacteraceae bacterium]|jgi:hypothetical protein
MPLISGRAARAALVGLTVLSLAPLAACAHRSPAARAAPAPNAIGVNSYLWRATLDTLAFMPLLSADPYGGVINTDWYINPEKADERFKCTVYILDTRLRGDALKVTVFKEVSNGAGGWTPSQASDQTAVDVENAILTRARQLRLSNLRG